MVGMSLTTQSVSVRCDSVSLVEHCGLFNFKTCSQSAVPQPFGLLFPFYGIKLNKCFCVGGSHPKLSAICNSFKNQQTWGNGNDDIGHVFLIRERAPYFL